MRDLTFFVFCLILVSAGCSKPETAQSPTSPPPANTPGDGQEATKLIDVCSLLTSQEIEAIQGAPVTDTKPSANSQGGLTVSQCYFLLPTAAESIVITVTQRANGADAHDAKQLWKDTFHRDNDKASALEEEESKAPPPERIDSLGDEAFWASRRFGGALYVLKGSIYLSISLGGANDQATKLQKSKAIAEIVLKRL